MTMTVDISVVKFIINAKETIDNAIKELELITGLNISTQAKDNFVATYDWSDPELVSRLYGSTGKLTLALDDFGKLDFVKVKVSGEAETE